MTGESRISNGAGGSCPSARIKSSNCSTRFPMIVTLCIACSIAACLRMRERRAESLFAVRLATILFIAESSGSSPALSLYEAGMSLRDVDDSVTYVLCWGGAPGGSSWPLVIPGRVPVCLRRLEADCSPSSSDRPRLRRDLASESGEVRFCPLFLVEAVSRRRGQGGGSAGRGAEQGCRFGDDRREGAGGERGRGGSLEIARGDCHGPGGVELLQDFLEVLESGGGHDIAAKGVLCLREAKSQCQCP
jgi:hypothetical protein